MPPSKLDALYRSLLLNKFFCKGWGSIEQLERLFEFRKIISNRDFCHKLVPADYPVEITKEQKTAECTILEGKFLTPLEHYLPGLVPKVAQDAYFQIMLPNQWREENYKPMCLHLAGTGDHFFWRRRNLMAKPLMKEANIGAMILENPFYGLRKPEDQRNSSLHNVSDIFVMGGCLILESLVLFHWCERNGLGPLGITGCSMGGHMASLAATNWPKPLVLVPCLSWSTASNVFTEGVMSQSINWDVLTTQYYADGQYRERLSKMVTIVDEAFVAGQHFIKNFNKSIGEMKKDIVETNEICNPPETESVNLTVIRDTNPEEAQKQFLEINGKSNKLNLSQSLLVKLLAKKKVELTAAEINELNEKIRIALNKIKVNNKDTNVTNNNTETLESAEKNPIQSDTSATEKSTIISSAYKVGRTKLMTYISPKSSTEGSEPVAKVTSVASEHEDIKSPWWERESMQFMRGMMDECTHLKNFSVPYDTELIIAVCAKDDAYIPRTNCSSLEEIWPGAEVREIADAGHVTAFVLHQKLFRSSIIDGFERSKKKWLAEKELEKFPNAIFNATNKDNAGNDATTV